MAEERMERDARVTELHGERAHVMCGRKLRYPSKESALRTANRCLRHGSVALRAYKCPYCGGWHLTKDAERE